MSGENCAAGYLWGFGGCLAAFVLPGGGRRPEVDCASLFGLNHCSVLPGASVQVSRPGGACVVDLRSPLRGWARMSALPFVWVNDIRNVVSTLPCSYYREQGESFFTLSLLTALWRGRRGPATFRVAIISWRWPERLQVVEWRQFMKSLFRLLISLLVLLATLLLVNCSGAPGCPPVQFGSSTCSSSGGSGFGGGGSGGGGGGGGGSGVSASSAAALVYYSTASIDAAGVTSSGTFGTLSSYSAPTLASNAADDMLIVNKQFLYVPMGDTTVVGYSITRSTGALTLIPGSPFTVPGGAATVDDLATDPAGKFLFVGSETAPDIWVFTISSSGGLTPVAGSPFTAGLVDSDILTVDASGKFLYAGQGDPTSGVAGFSINSSTGALTALTGSPFALGVAQLHASPNAELLLGVAEIQDNATGATEALVHVFNIDPNTGALSVVAGSPFITDAAPFDFAISPNGNFVYVLEETVGTGNTAPIQGFTLNPATGAMASIGTFSGVPTAQGCRFDQSGLYLFCVDTLFGATLTVNGANPSSGALVHGADLPVSGNFPFAVTD